mmetsp:Transcript_131041/g.261417  ORF Transcript_131041/g.261417 Transcript_131041/m.261417 type:complete len:102 (+) Transcript_131041:1055-1360(+)
MDHSGIIGIELARLARFAICASDGEKLLPVDAMLENWATDRSEALRVAKFDLEGAVEQHQNVQQEQPEYWPRRQDGDPTPLQFHQRRVAEKAAAPFEKSVA